MKLAAISAAAALLLLSGCGDDELEGQTPVNNKGVAGPTCGDGIVEAPEECDVSAAEAPGCDTSCACKLGLDPDPNSNGCIDAGGGGGGAGGSGGQGGQGGGGQGGSPGGGGQGGGQGGGGQGGA